MAPINKSNNENKVIEEEAKEEDDDAVDEVDGNENNDKSKYSE